MEWVSTLMSRRGQLGKSEHQKTAATKYEKKLAKELGGTPVVGSGAFSCGRGDVQAKGFLFDSKQIAKSCVTLSSTILSKITREAAEEGKYPGIIATLDTTAFGVSKVWAVIPLPILNELLDVYYKEKGV